jgi:hypothetical protein
MPVATAGMTVYVKLDNPLRLPVVTGEVPGLPTLGVIVLPCEPSLIVTVFPLLQLPLPLVHVKVVLACSTYPLDGPEQE